MIITKQSYTNLLKHFILWILFSVYWYLFQPGTEAGLTASLVGNVIKMLSFVIVFYFLGLVIFPHFWLKNYFLIIFFIATTYFVFHLMRWVNYNYLYPYLDNTKLGEIGFLQLWNSSLYLFFFVTLASFSYFHNRRGLKQLKEQNAVEQILLDKEINFLKGQFNSHITFNFLNFCYSHIHKDSPKTAEAIELFSDMLRYSLKIKPEEKVSIVQEIEYIKNFLDLQKLLYKKVYVNFECRGETNERSIVPHILATFVENAFNYGITNNKEDPMSISLIIYQEKIDLSIKTKIDPSRKKESQEYSQENFLDILNLFYYKNYEFTLEEKDNKYHRRLLLTN